MPDFKTSTALKIVLALAEMAKESVPETARSNKALDRVSELILEVEGREDLHTKSELLAASVWLHYVTWGAVLLTWLGAALVGPLMQPMWGNIAFAAGYTLWVIDARWKGNFTNARGFAPFLVVAMWGSFAWLLHG